MVDVGFLIDSLSWSGRRMLKSGSRESTQLRSSALYALASLSGMLEESRKVRSMKISLACSSL